MFAQRGPGNTTLGGHGRGVFWCEGRLDALLSDTELTWNLRPASDLTLAERIARQALDELAGEFLADLEWRPEGEVRRFDLAHEFSFSDGRDGLAFMHTVSGMTIARRKISTWRGQDQKLQTVYIRHLRSGVVDARLYDKGVESGSSNPGERLRFEVQRRPPRSKRMRPAVVASLDLRREFGRGLAPYLAHSVVACGPQAAVEHLAQMAVREELSIAKAERLVGTLHFMREYGRSIYETDKKARRRLADLREAGISLEDELPPNRTVPVGRLLAQAVEAFSA